MGEQLNYIDLVRRARLGDKHCLNQLAEPARERLRVYVYRLTQNHDLTQEIVQETMLEMCKILGKLKKADRFWPWLYGIAINKLHRHQRTEHTRKRANISAVKNANTSRERQDSLENLVGKELKQIISAAMQKLKTRHKAVLVMRCYDGMSYAQIAEAMGCSEFGIRMLFLRAKKSLQKELSRNGFGKGALLTALVLFGKITAPSEAAAAQVTVTAAATKVGALATLVSLATSKTAIISLTTAGVITAGTVATTSSILHKDQTEVIPKQIGSSQIVSPLGQLANGGEEYWYYFPDGPSGPMMMRAKSGEAGDKSAWQLLQNDRANYYYNGDTICINNHRMWTSDLSVFRMPTDTLSLSEFLTHVEGQTTQMNHISASGRGLLVIAIHNKDQSSPHLFASQNRSSGGPWAIRHYNVLDEDYFQSDWPTGVRITDNRDAMHKRGWTYFRVTGQVNGANVTGSGRLPFVYATSRQHSQWLNLQVGMDFTITDTSVGASICSARGKLLAGHKAGTFFKGLPRPWMGLHTIDTIRRDAAEKKVWFETKHTAHNGKVELDLSYEQVLLKYKIDMETDVIDEMILFVGDNEIGYLKFSYLQEVGNVGGDFTEPRIQSNRQQQKDEGLLWLVKLAEGSLGK